MSFRVYYCFNSFTDRKKALKIIFCWQIFLSFLTVYDSVYFKISPSIICRYCLGYWPKAEPSRDS